MQIKNFNIAVTPTPVITSINSNNHFDQVIVEGGFAALLRQQNQAASAVLVRAPLPAPAPAPPVQAPAPAPALAPVLPKSAPAPARPAAFTDAPRSTAAYQAPTAPPTSEESQAPDSTRNGRPAQIVNSTRTADKARPAQASRDSLATGVDLPVDNPEKAETTQDGNEDASKDPLPGQQPADPHRPTKPAPAVPGGAPPNTAKPATGHVEAPDDAATKSTGRREIKLATRRDATPKADAELPGKAARDLGERSASLPVSNFAAALAGHRSVMTAAEQIVDQASSASANDNAGAAALVSGAAFNLASGAAREASLMQALHLSTPVSEPDFAQDLGAQLSVLARDGVQQAELHLNPADMGPVSIHITMDGTQARIDFGADVAATRHAIEAGMPELASALADAGFTLAGGGVSQHPRGRGDGNRGEPGSGQSTRRVVTGSTGTAPAPRVIRSAVSVGGVDLYA